MNRNRREFLRQVGGTSSLLSFAPAVPSFLLHSAVAAAPKPGGEQTVLVVLQLSGGNDGLNTVVPYADDAYHRSRPTLALPVKGLHQLNDHVGFHPEMTAFRRLHDEGALTVVQGVGYPKSDRNHEVAMRAWQTARPDAPQEQTGWLGRMLDASVAPTAVSTPALFVGQIPCPHCLNAQQVIVPSIHSARDLTLTPSPLRAGEPATETPARDDTSDHPLRSVVVNGLQRARAWSARVEAGIRQPSRRGDYPASPLAADLRTIAELIRADVGIRIFVAELGGGGIGGFDNHANQAGNHAALLRQLADGIAAFARDLRADGLLDRVLLATYSEFGRTLAENGRRGTDHGAAAPMFLVGGRVRPGLIGPHPSLTDLDQGGLKFHTDFRQVYATLLKRWLGLDSRAALGGEFTPVDLVKS
jgi:uncharacterized protein (DUF1501 family)